MIASYNLRVYIILILIDFILFVILIFALYFFMYHDFDLYVYMQIPALVCETTMAIYISYLFSKPLIKLSAKSKSIDKDVKNGNLDKIKKDLAKNKLIHLSTKLLLLSGISLGSIVIIRLIIVVAYPYCNAISDGECWLVYVSYGGWAIDSFINIVCLLLAFKNGKIYYDKYCQKFHDFLMSQCVVKYYVKKVQKYANT